LPLGFRGTFSDRIQGKLPVPGGETSIADEVFPDGDASKK
jgi:hypothetical protein